MSNICCEKSLYCLFNCVCLIITILTLTYKRNDNIIVSFKLKLDIAYVILHGILWMNDVKLLFIIYLITCLSEQINHETVQIMFFSCSLYMIHIEWEHLIKEEHENSEKEKIKRSNNNNNNERSNNGNKKKKSIE